MKNMKPCIILYLMLTFLTGAVYPVVVTAISQLLFNVKANGSIVRMGDDIQGSLLIGQNFTSPAYFWPRPSISGYCALPAAASNQGPTSDSLKRTVDERRSHFAPFIAGEIPADLLLASGSGLDPHISPEGALAQVDHVAKARNLSESQKTELDKLVKSYIEPPQWGIFGAPRVNVLNLNMGTDLMFGLPEAWEMNSLDGE